jgi:hypothetical protein
VPSFWPFRRKETLNERLLREAGVDAGSIAGELAPGHDPADQQESWFDERSLLPFERLSGEVSAARPRRWDAVVSAETTGVRGQEVDFVSLPDGSLVIDEGEAEGDLTPLAEAVEARIASPYRAHGTRRSERGWAVAARKIEVASFAADGDEITLSEHGGNRTMTIDGEEAVGSVRELEEVGRRQGDSYVVRAQRIDGDLWEVSANPL